ncbi:ATPase, putative [Trichomonas vaginalis G3]|uniref:histidine kinase n=1 Tax=Trichomonas vaginalis (strain ATCC PRA-98 / G3) TaxID=412133 RepID=A2G1K1_TRIV3|nr:phosphorelay sensor kinase protein [Trichomonas vaginalis G3]EAX88959.1 ATPase, putative [Trichomonas vaginalis G3]KAI5484909.1 phosphorelay sensor kinase protein [Trichomonas vaginalis G3]|eukprot:XP_001301889.1 ATPase [Trichomonas vaginalis G3]
MNILFFLGVVSIRRGPFLYKSSQQTDPLVSMDANTPYMIEIAEQFFIKKISVSLSLSNTTYIITESEIPPDGYKMIEFEDSELDFISLPKKYSLFNRITISHYPKIEISSLIFVLIVVAIAFIFPYKKQKNVLLDKSIFLQKNEKKDLLYLFDSLECDQINSYLVDPEKSRFFFLRPARVGRKTKSAIVYYVACLPIKNHCFIFCCQFENTDSHPVHLQCKVTMDGGRECKSTVKFTSYRDFRPLKVEYMIDNNVEVITYLPATSLGPLVPFGNLISISNSMFFNANEFFDRDSLLNFNFSKILRSYCTKLNIDRAYFYTPEHGLFHFYTKQGLQETNLNEVKKLFEKFSAKSSIEHNVFREGDTCMFNKSVLKVMTVYTILDITNIPDDKGYYYFFLNLICDFCVFLFQISLTKEQNLMFLRFADLISRPSSYSLFEVSLRTKTVTLARSTLFPPDCVTFDQILNKIYSSGDPMIKQKMDALFETFMNVNVVNQQSFEIHGEKHQWFNITSYATNDRITKEVICSIIVEDITPIKQQEIDLRDSLIDLKFSSEALSLNKFSVNGTEITDLSDNLGRILGRSERPVRIDKIIHPADENLMTWFGKKMVTVRLQRGDGSYMYFSLFANNNVGFAFNTDEAVKTREKLQMTGKGLQLASVTSSLIFWSFDLITGTVMPLLQQPTIWETLSVDPQTKFFKFLDFIHPDEKEAIETTLTDLKDEKTREWTGECRILKYGKYEWHRIIFAIAKQHFVHAFAASISSQKETAKQFADNCKIRDIIFSSGKLTVWKYFDDDLPVTEHTRLIPGIATVVRVNRTFVNTCMAPEVAAVFREKIRQTIETNEVMEFKVSEDDRFYSIRGKYQPTSKQVVGICIDVTDVERANQELEEQRKIAVEANKQKTLFLANMSHEIRTPMNPIFGLLDIIAQGEITGEQRLLVDTMRSLSFQLLKLLDDTLNLSKIEQGDMEMNVATFDFWAAIEPAIVASASRARKDGIKFIVRSSPKFPLKINHDVHLIQQILNNLFSNALKFTKKGFIELAVSWAEEEDQEVIRIAVSDTGIGISYDQQKIIFQRYFQADPSNPVHYGGSGLGLALVQEIVHFIGGSLRLESEPGKGSTFLIDIPIESAYFPTLPVFKGASKTIMVLSSDGINREIIRAWAVDLHFAVKFVENADEALGFMRTEGVAGTIVDTCAADVNKLVPEAKTPLCAVIEAEEGSKAEFRITRPILPHALCKFLNFCRFGIKTKHDTQQSSEPTKKRVLVVEDNKQNQFVMKKILEKLGCSFEMADNGQIAIDILNANIDNPFDLVFMDCQMPVLDGLSATRKIRASGKPYANMHIIALTANAIEGDRESCLAAGMDDYLSKPVRIQQIKNALTMFD